VRRFGAGTRTQYSMDIGSLSQFNQRDDDGGTADAIDLNT
jgi:hypothetical protein